MDETLIYDGKATLDDLCILNGLGYVFEINDGKIVGVEKE